jgi:hypothetical protein
MKMDLPTGTKGFLARFFSSKNSKLGSVAPIFSILLLFPIAIILPTEKTDPTQRIIEAQVTKKDGKSAKCALIIVCDARAVDFCFRFRPFGHRSGGIFWYGSGLWMVLSWNWAFQVGNCSYIALLPLNQQMKWDWIGKGKALYILLI